jgi:hypothetical protein
VKESKGSITKVGDLGTSENASSSRSKFLRGEQSCNMMQPRVI